MSRTLDRLDRRFRPLAYELIARLAEEGFLVAIAETRRELNDHIHPHTRWHAPDQRVAHIDGLAIDLYYRPLPYLPGIPSPTRNPLMLRACAWGRIAAISDRLGLRSASHGTLEDPGHFEYVEPDP